jgi:rhodanese-related sulfurtransferase
VVFSIGISRTEAERGQVDESVLIWRIMANRISCHDVAVLMASDKLYAVLDVRERGEFNECQVSKATSLPRSQIEFRIAALVPNPTIPVVVYDEGGKRAELAAATLANLGYFGVSVLEGGLAAWKRETLPTVSGVNVPSKAFGERIHKQRDLPEITPEELKSWQAQEKDLLIFDVRTPEEYGRFCIPGGVNVPGGDLILWAKALKQKPETTVVVNCAGRTRSIIGTATLCRLGLTNVRALKNGTMGWLLAGFELESKPARAAVTPPVESAAKASELARQIAQTESIPWTSVDELGKLLHRSNDSGVTYLIDVRSEEEYQSGHISGSLNVPGGQAVQRTDDFVAVRNGTIIFISNEAARAVMAAYWYRQMGFRHASVLQGGLRAWSENGQPLVRGASYPEPLGLEVARNAAQLIAPAELARRLQRSSLLVLDVGMSLDFEAAHIPGARWMSRGWIEIKLPERFPDRAQPIVVTCADGRNSVFAARALTEIGYTDVLVLQGGVRAWVAAGSAAETGLDRRLAEPNDVVLSPSIRGNQEDMKKYLEWEVKLDR